MSLFSDRMERFGFDRYDPDDIAEWFKYTNIVEYYIGNWDSFLFICCYIVLIFALVFTVLVDREAKKEVIVFEDSVLYKASPKKSKQLIFDDISNVDFGKTTLKVTGVGVKFKISNLTNAESIKSVIIEKKANAQKKFDSSATSNIDEIKKYKELLDSGVISQEEFDAKKKQILGV